MELTCNRVTSWFEVDVKPQSHSQPRVSPARWAAFEILRRVEETDAYATTLLAKKQGQLAPKDRALAHELVLGVLRRQLWLDRVIAHFSDRDTQRLDVPVRIVLRLGLYQLRFMSRVPASAAVNESVNLVRQVRLKSAAPFVNALLRRATREPDFDPAAGLTNQIERLAVQTSHPEWLVQRWIDNFGVAEASAFAIANNDAPPTAFRIVDQPHSQVLATLKEAGVEPVPSSISPLAWRAKDSGSLLHELASRGQIYLQDEASQLVAHVLGAQAGETVLDVCAAPGSKTTQIAGLAGDKSLVVAGDLYARRLRTVIASSGLQRLKNIRCLVLNGLNQLPFADAPFDRVLVDAPCTGTGTLRRNPEIRWRLEPPDIRELSTRQLKILLNAAQVVKPGGRLVYSTCSVEPEENEEVIKQFLDQAKDFAPAALKINTTFLTSTNTARIRPHREASDGFFIAAFERK